MIKNIIYFKGSQCFKIDPAYFSPSLIETEHFITQTHPISQLDTL